MNLIINGVQTLCKGLGGIIFPEVCICCGNESTVDKHNICSFCLESRFEDANPANSFSSSNLILPEGIIAQHALWLYKKGTDLQHVIRQFKYERMRNLGKDLGRELGYRVQHHPLISKILQKEAILLPVPLHRQRFRTRGFNQAHEIALGVQQVWSKIPICKRNDVVRVKMTRTQTGFSLQRRLQNIKGAFQVNNKSAIDGKTVIIIDDVFTTGATSFELAQVLRRAGVAGIVILTIAQA